MRGHRVSRADRPLTHGHVLVHIANVNDLSTDPLSIRTGELTQNTRESLLLPSVSLLRLGTGGEQPTSSTWQWHWRGPRGEGAWRASNRGHIHCNGGLATQTPSKHRTLLRTFVRDQVLSWRVPLGAHVEPQLRARCSCSTDLLPYCRDLVSQMAQDHANRCKSPSPPRVEKPSSAHGAVTPGCQHGHAVFHSPAADCPSL